MKKNLLKSLAAIALLLAVAPISAKPKFRTVEKIKKSGTIKIAVFSDK